MNGRKLVCEEDSCTACGSCIQICPQQCISYIKNEHDTKVANISLKDCISCQMCEKACPQFTMALGKESVKCYASWSTDENDRRTSASGGIATEIYKYFALNSGLYAGVSMDESFLCTYKLLDKEEYNGEFKNSKYVYSDTCNVYIKIKEALEKQKQVVFIGLPCQVDGLKAYLRAKKVKNDKLYLVDIVCHGTSPAEYLISHIKHIEKRKNRKAKQVFFRDPEEGTHTFTFSLRDDNEILYKKKVHRTDTYQIGYHNGIIYRDNCYECRYACSRRHGDLTIADFSGLGKIRACQYSGKNVSCVLINTEKGQKLFDEMINSGRIQVEERPLEEALKFEKQLMYPTPKTNTRKKFVEFYEHSHDFEYAIKRSMFTTIIKNEIKYHTHIDIIYYFVAKMVPQRLKRQLKKIFIR